MLLAAKEELTAQLEHYAERFGEFQDTLQKSNEVGAWAGLSGAGGFVMVHAPKYGKAAVPQPHLTAAQPISTCQPVRVRPHHPARPLPLRPASLVRCHLSTHLRSSASLLQTFASLRDQMEGHAKARATLTRERDEARRRAEANDSTIMALVQDRLGLKQQVGSRVGQSVPDRSRVLHFLHMNVNQMT